MQTKYIQRFLWFYLIAMFFISAYIYGIVLKANGDNVEHLHTSWMVWMGYMPYKDFFQHHNPLTWYLSAPLVAYLIDDFSIYSIFNIISMSMLYGIAYYQAKLLFLDNSNKIASLFLAALLVSAYSLLWSTDYRPDTFMFLFFYMGLYYLFVYLKKENDKFLIISFLSFFISFMFTQKVLMHLIIPGLAVIYWLLIGKMKFSHFVKACTIPLILLACFVGYLYHHDALKVYWLSNYPFNTYIPKIFEEQRIIFPPREYIDFYVFLPIASIASFYFLYKGSILERLFSIMFLVETALRMLYFSAFLHYVIFWLMLSIMLSVMFLARPLKYRKLIIWANIIYLLTYSAYAHQINYTHVTAWLGFGILILAIFFTQKVNQNNFLAGVGIIYLLFVGFYSYQLTYKNNIKTHDRQNGHEIAFNILTPCDYAINGYYATYNLKAKDPGYYAILLGQIDVLGEKAGIAKRDDLNELIRTKKPKMISAGIFWDTYWEQRGKKIPAHKIDPYLIKTYYDYSGAGDIHILKPEYQKHGCVYNGKEWRFMD